MMKSNEEEKLEKKIVMERVNNTHKKFPNENKYEVN